MYEIEPLKRIAKKINKDFDLGHMKSLDFVASSLGYSSWNLLKEKNQKTHYSGELLMIYGKSKNEIRSKLSTLEFKKGIRYVDTDMFMKEMIDHIKQKRLDDLEDRYSSYQEVLIFDDFQNIKNKTGTQGVLNRIRKNRNDRMIFLSLTPKNELIAAMEENNGSLSLIDAFSECKKI